MPKTEPFDKHLNKYEDWFEENEYALECFRFIAPDGMLGLAYVGMYHFIDALNRLAVASERKGIERLRLIGGAFRRQRKIKHWARHS